MTFGRGLLIAVLLGAALGALVGLVGWWPVIVGLSVWGLIETGRQSGTGVLDRDADSK